MIKKGLGAATRRGPITNKQASTEMENVDAAESTPGGITLDFGISPQDIGGAAPPEESWEPVASAIPDISLPPTATLPLIRRAIPKSPISIGREPPHSIDAEKSLLSCCFVAPAAMEQVSLSISAHSFFLPAHRTIFATMLDLVKKGKPVEVSIVADVLQTQGRLKQVGGVQYLLEVSNSAATTGQTGHFIDRVRSLEVRREILGAGMALAERALDDAVDPVELEARVAGIGMIASDGESLDDGEPITDFSYPEGDDPNILLGSDDYLGRGGGMLLVSHAGAGKSSFVMDAVMTWALGLPWMGIRSNGALKTLVIQCEDSRRYVGKVYASFATVNKLSDAQAAQLKANCIIVRLRGVSGARFLSRLRQLVAKHNPDLVVINPLYLYAEGDIARSEFAQPFLVELDAVNKDEKFGYIIVHHTGKPIAKDNKGQRAELDDWETAYMGFGSSYLANWPRCSALIEPRQGQPGKYWLKLGKAGVNAGVVKEVEHQASKRLEPVTKIAMRHSAERMTVNGRERAVIYWEPDEDSGSPPANASAEKKAGRPIKYEFSSFRPAFPSGEANRKTYQPIYRAAIGCLEIPKSSFNSLLVRWKEVGEICQHEDGRYYIPTP